MNDSDYKHASICVLSYQRLDFLKRTMKSLLGTPSGYKMEIIVHDDGSDVEVKDYLYGLLKEKKISYLILNGGNNRGIGESIRNSFKISSGKYLFKLDTDLEFEENWLKEAIDILEDTHIGAVSLFDYRHYDPMDDRFEVLKETDKCKIVSDFVSSIYGVTRGVYEKFKHMLDTDGWHQYIKEQRYSLAITKEDKVHNFGFGIENSIYMDKDKNDNIIVRKTYKYPLIK